MRKVSLKRAKRNRDAQPERDAYRMEFRDCQVPGCGLPATDLHEIARGNGIRVNAISERAAWLHLCRSHHEEMGKAWVWPLAKQLALKLLVDPDAFDRETIAALRGRAPESITLSEVVENLRLA